MKEDHIAHPRKREISSHHSIHAVMHAKGPAVCMLSTYLASLHQNIN